MQRKTAKIIPIRRASAPRVSPGVTRQQHIMQAQTAKQATQLQAATNKTALMMARAGGSQSVKMQAIQAKLNEKHAKINAALADKSAKIDAKARDRAVLAAQKLSVPVNKWKAILDNRTATDAERANAKAALFAINENHQAALAKIKLDAQVAKATAILDAQQQAMALQQSGQNAITAASQGQMSAPVSAPASSSSPASPGPQTPAAVSVPSDSGVPAAAPVSDAVLPAWADTTVATDVPANTDFVVQESSWETSTSPNDVLNTTDNPGTTDTLPPDYQGADSSFDSSYDSSYQSYDGMSGLSGATRMKTVKKITRSDVVGAINKTLAQIRHANPAYYPYVLAEVRKLDPSVGVAGLGDWTDALSSIGSSFGNALSAAATSYGNVLAAKANTADQINQQKQVAKINKSAQSSFMDSLMSGSTLLIIGVVGGVGALLWMLFRKKGR